MDCVEQGLVGDSIKNPTLQPGHLLMTMSRIVRRHVRRMSGIGGTHEQKMSLKPVEPGLPYLFPPIKQNASRSPSFVVPFDAFRRWYRQMQEYESSPEMIIRFLKRISERYIVRIAVRPRHISNDSLAIDDKSPIKVRLAFADTR